MIKHEDEEFDLVRDLINQLVDYLLCKPSPLAWDTDKEGDYTRPKLGGEIKARSLCFESLVEHFGRKAGIDFTYSWNDFYWGFRDEWTWRTSP